MGGGEFGDVAQMVECLPSRYKALRSNSSTEKFNLIIFLFLMNIIRRRAGLVNSSE
jgi:hypothetical protein